VIGSAADGQRPEVTRIAAVRPRHQVTVIGTVRSVAVETIGASPAFRCGIADGSGEIALIFLGREQVAGLVLGRRCTAEGMACVYRGNLVIWNPRYVLEPSDPPYEGTGGVPARRQPETGRVVIIHDDLGLARIIEINLATRGYRVIAAGTAVAADCEELRSADLVIVDIGLAGAAGIKTVAMIHDLTDARILAISALNDEAVRQAVMSAGAGDFLVKPFPIGLLITRVAELAEHGRAGVTLRDSAG
jgi:CheY-like chemotaxis protein